MLRWLAALVIVAAVASSNSSTALAQPLDSAPAKSEGYVTAQGTARVYRKPDHLDVVIGVESIAGTAGEANERCGTTMEAALKAIKEMNLAGADFKTGSVQLSPRYERRDYEEGMPARIIGYTAINTVRVRTGDLKAAAKIIDAALKSGANRVDGVEFGIKEVLEPREEALRMATRAAKRKAGVMAESLDVGLGRVISITETTQQYSPWSNRSNLAQVQMVNESGPPPGNEAIEPGMIEIVVEVTLAYALTKK